MDVVCLLMFVEEEERASLLTTTTTPQAVIYRDMYMARESVVEALLSLGMVDSVAVSPLLVINHFMQLHASPQASKSKLNLEG
jgi:hypothetical protein